MLALEVLMARRLTRSVPVLGLLAAVVTLWPGAARAQYGATNGEWPTYADDLGGTKYSALDQSDASNFGLLEIAWRWEPADGVASNFERMVRIADSTGIELGHLLEQASADVRTALGLERPTGR